MEKRLAMLITVCIIMSAFAPYYTVQAEETVNLTDLIIMPDDDDDDTDIILEGEESLEDVFSEEGSSQDGIFNVQEEQDVGQGGSAPENSAALTIEGIEVVSHSSDAGESAVKQEESETETESESETETENEEPRLDTEEVPFIREGEPESWMEEPEEAIPGGYALIPEMENEKEEETEEYGILSLASSSSEVSWTSGSTTVTYEDGVLTVSGSGAMEDYNSYSAMPWYGYGTRVECIVVESGVTHIGSLSFAKFSSVTDVSLPTSLVSIGSGAFSACTELTSITIPDGVTTIADGAFADCLSLSSIKLGKKVETIDDYALQNTVIKTLTIPASVKTIGEQICYGCSNLTSYSVESGNTKYASSDGVLFDKNKTKLIAYPVGKTSTSYTIPSTVTSIVDYAFYKAVNLKSISIPNSVKTIGTGAFAYCTALTTITIPDSVTSIGESLFYGCTALKTAVIGSGLKVLPPYTFYNCTALTNVTLSEGLTTIEEFAFYNCTSLESITIPSTVTTIDNYGFYKCPNLSIKLPAGIQKLENGKFVVADNVKITGKCLYAQAYKVLKLVNQERKAEGLSSLTMDKELLQTAMQRAAECCIDFSHNRPSGASCFSASTKSCGENIASGYDSASSVMRAWMNSSGHKANILDSDYQSVGIGAFKQGDTIYWVQCFGMDKATSVSQPSDGSKTFTVAISPDEMEGAVLYMNPAKTTIKAGNSTTVQIGFKGTSQYSKSIYAELDPDSFTWSSSAAASVNSKGKVTGEQKGTATVKAKTATGKFSASTKIKVKANYDTAITDLKNKKKGIKISWSKAGSADGYYLYRKTKGGSYKKIKTIKNINKLTYTDTSVKDNNGTAYTYKITAYVGNKTGNASTKSTVRLTGTDLKQAKSEASKSMTVKWKKASSVNGYQIQYSTSEDFTGNKKKTTAKKASKTKKVISSLTKGKTYYVRVRTYKIVGKKVYYSAWSTARKVKVK